MAQNTTIKNTILEDGSIPFGLDENGKVVYAQDIPESDRGLKCNCTCAICGQPLVAKLGKVRQWHFTHLAGYAKSKSIVSHRTKKARETALALLAREILLEADSFLLPALNVPVHRLAEGITDSRVRRSVPKILEYRSAAKIAFSGVKTEPRLKNVVSDAVVGQHSNGEILIVCAISQPSTSKAKLKAFAQLGLPTVELDLRDVDVFCLTREELRYELLENPVNRRWLGGPEMGKAKEWAQKEFLKIAEQKIRHFAQQDERERIAAERKRELNPKKQLEGLRREEERQTYNNGPKQDVLPQKPIKNTASAPAKPRKITLPEFISWLNSDKIVPAGRFSRWLMCVHCGCIDLDSKFVAYGGVGQTNKGLCRECYYFEPKLIWLWSKPVVRDENEKMAEGVQVPN